ncbi:MAG TPA: GDSL-type esterase/lipase family protein [Arthrobacter sp.]|nr:GDSL-type esterase/lipase family protein [Arthrobacter sp.]
MALLAAATVAALTGLGLVAASGVPNQAGPTAAATAPVATGTPGQPTPYKGAFAGVTVLLLGDSLAAGEGGSNYLNGTDEPHQRCHRSAAGWFAGTAAEITNLGCSRAIIRNLTAPQTDPEYNARPEPAQLEAASGRMTDITLVMLGGNDIRFAEIFNQCVLSDADCTADPAFRSRALSTAEALSDSLAGAYLRVAEHVGGTAVLVPAYPRLFGDATAGCGRISPAEAKFATDLITALNHSVRTGAEAAAETHPAVRFVPATEAAFSGHGACDLDPYVHTVLPTALIGAVQEPSAAQELLHPNAAGYAKLTEALAGWLAANPSVISTAPSSSAP